MLKFRDDLGVLSATVKYGISPRVLLTNCIFDDIDWRLTPGNFPKKRKAVEKKIECSIFECTGDEPRHHRGQGERFLCQKGFVALDLAELVGLAVSCRERIMGLGIENLIAMRQVYMYYLNHGFRLYAALYGGTPVNWNAFAPTLVLKNKQMSLGMTNIDMDWSSARIPDGLYVAKKIE